MAEVPSDSYESQLVKLQALRPTTAISLQLAHTNRQARLAYWLESPLLAGFEELLGFLTSIHGYFKIIQGLSSIDFLVERSRRDFVTALEATLSGYYSVTFDAMRDTMEIELLLWDFLSSPSHVAEWLAGDPKVLRGKFSPVRLRERRASTLGCKPEDMQDSLDYKGHSQSLHVNPSANPFFTQGVVENEFLLWSDSDFVEIFEHGRRIAIATSAIADSVRPELGLSAKVDALDQLKAAWKRTMESMHLRVKTTTVMHMLMARHHDAS